MYKREHKKLSAWLKVRMCAVCVACILCYVRVLPYRMNESKKERKEQCCVQCTWKQAQTWSKHLWFSSNEERACSCIYRIIIFSGVSNVTEESSQMKNICMYVDMNEWAKVYPFHRNLDIFSIARSLFLIALVFYFAKLLQSNNLVSFIYIYIYAIEVVMGILRVRHASVRVCVSISLTRKFC